MGDLTESFENKDTRSQKGGFAPGNYTCKCHVCDKCFMGDKRASQCAPCVYLDDYIPRKDIESLAKSFDRLVDRKIGCDGVLLVSTKRYNETVKLFNEILGNGRK